MVVVKVKDLDVDTITTAKIPPTGYPLGQTIIGNYSVVNSRLQSWYNDADSVPPTPNDAQANSCLVFEDQYYDSEHLTPSLPTCILYTKTPGTYKVTVTTLKHSIGPESVVKMYDVRPSTFAEYGTYTNWKDLTKSGKYDLWEVSIKKTNYYNGVYLKEVNGTKYIYVYRSEQKKDPESGIFTTTDYTLTYDTATETVTCSDTTINPETDVIISVHLDQVISTVPDNATSLGKPSADKVGKMLTTVDLGEGVIDNKWQSRRYEYQWVDAPTGGSKDAIKYTEQTLTDTQKKQARANIGAISKSLGLTGATVGKTVKISAVDSNGAPTAWEPVDMVKGDPGKSAYQYAQDGGYTGTEADFTAKLGQETLSGTTDDLTPAQVYAAVSAGRPVKVQYTSNSYGVLLFTAFNIAETMSVIASQSIVIYNNEYILAELYGNIKSGGGWFFSSTTLAEKKDIPTVPSSLKNPNALTIKIGSNTVTYDGSTAKTVEISDGSEVSY